MRLIAALGAATDRGSGVRVGICERGRIYDLIVRNGRILDGTGNPWFRADVAIKGGRIAAIGPLPNATASRTIDAAGRIVAPGFIDVHTHIEGAVERIRAATTTCSTG